MRASFLLAFLAGFLFYGSCQTTGDQNPEFRTNANGLMYSDADLKVLRHIVDSLNIRYKSCTLSQPYYSYPQQQCYYVAFSSKQNNLQAIIKDIKANLDFASLIQKYADMIENLDSGRLIIQVKNGFLEGKPSEGYERIYDSGKEFQKSRLWMYLYEKKDRYNESYSLYCRYLTAPLKQTEIPNEYGRLIQYVDCMIDTSATVLLYDRSDRLTSYKERETILSKVSNYLNDRMKVKRTNKGYGYLTDAQVEYALNNLQNDQQFRELIQTTKEELIEKHTGDDGIEQILLGLGFKEDALLMKRSRRVIGMCSQDLSPRNHARNIALLAAETRSWDIFLRAHMDIMNDRFERASDGSYAWGQRKTYLKELEELDLNIIDLMLGLSLRARNIADGHYYGTIWRLGWALSESKEKELFETKAQQMMQDERLDEFNRGLIFLLYKSYLNGLDDKGFRSKKINELKLKAELFPEPIKTSIIALKENEE